MIGQRGALTTRVLELRLWGDRPFVLFDVGCSGGIDGRWQAFGDRLQATGFDPLVNEIGRLNALNTHPGVRYEAAFVSCANFDRLFPPELRQDRIASKNNDPFPRVSAAAAQRRLDTSYVQQQFNAGAEIVMSDRTIALDDYVGPSERAGVDFLKVDTDGHDIEVILGAEGIMSAGGILGVRIEAPFHGASHEYSNTFANIDRILRQRGFTLFDLPIYRYSRADLPAPFVWDLAAQTTSGQAVWGEALYLRDLGDVDYDRMWGYDITPERVLKLACLFDLFGLPDCGAELVINRARFLDVDAREDLLDRLASATAGSYGEHIRLFREDFTRFYASRIQALDAGAANAILTARAVEGLAQLSPVDPIASGSVRDDSDSVERLRDRMKGLTRKNEDLRAKLAERDRRLEQITERAKALKASRGGSGDR